MQRIVVLNPKGGSGKTTIATNLAACYAANGDRPALMDLDPQASSMRWLRKRPNEAAPIHGIAAFERSATVTRSWQTRIPAECGVVVIDTPAAIDPLALPDLTRGADAVLVPAMPSAIARSRRERSAAGVADQEGNALRAASMADSASFVSPAATFA